MRLQLIAPTALFGLFLFAGCGSGDSGDAKAVTAAKPATTATVEHGSSMTKTVDAAARGKTLKVVKSNYGKVVADTTGEALYLFTADKGTKSKCYGECATAWPPLLTKGEPRAGKGIDGAKLGTTKRRDGRTQVTYNGHPLYYYRDDAPGKILCQAVNEFGGGWYVVDPKGRRVN